MPDSDSLQSQEQQLKHREHHAERTEQAGEQLAQISPADTLPLGPSLLSDANIGRRGNAPIQAATIQRMQQAYGNRATRRYLQRHADNNHGADGNPEEEQPLQRASASVAPVPVQRHPVQQKDDEEEEQRPTPVQKMSASQASIYVQRQDESPQQGPALQTPPGAGGGDNASAPGQQPQGGQSQAVAPGNLIIDDGVRDLQPGQMHRGQFLSELRSTVTGTVDSVLSGTPYAALAAPQIEEQFARYSAMNSRSLEQTILQQVPGAGGAHTAAEYLPLIARKVRDTVQEQIPKDGIGGALAEGASVLSSIAQGVGNAISSVASGIGNAISSIFFKGREGGPRPADAATVQRQLSEASTGQALPSDTRTGLEAAFGADLSGVRVHTDSGASQMSDSLNARAFTVGRDITFGSGEYQPGTAVGDALIAHEVAHVVQQGNGQADGAVMKKGEGGESTLEEEADTSAVRALVSMWSGARSGLANVTQNAMPAMRTGLRLQRCGRPKMSEAEANRLENIKNYVKKTPQGTHAIEVVDKYKVGAIFTDGPGSVFDPNDNTIKMDKNRSDLDLSFTFVHESNHAEYANKKMQADVMTDTREAYVDKMLSEETEGQALSILAKMDIEANPGDIDMSKATERAGESSFKKGYKKGYDDAKAAKKSEDEAKTAGIAAGKILLRKDFDEGITIVTSNTHESYKVYYGKEWDKRHTK